MSLNLMPLREDRISQHRLDFVRRGEVDPVDGMRWMFQGWPLISDAVEATNAYKLKDTQPPRVTNDMWFMNMRDTLAREKAPVGSLWINSTTGDSYVMTSVNKPNNKGPLSFRNTGDCVVSSPPILSLKGPECFTDKSIRQRTREAVLECINSWTRS